MSDQRAIESRVPFARRWHVIAEIDLMRLVADHAEMEQLCARLEAIADALPDRPDPTEAELACLDLDDLPAAHNAREDQLLPAMFARDLAGTLTHSLLDHIHGRHVACAVEAQDLAAALRAGADGPQAVAAETLGYMLRCFFRGCRDAMAFEQLAILALAGNRLTPGARALLTEGLARTCQPA